MLPAELWKDKNAKFLDPVCKTGVFLREIAKRLMEGLEKEIPDRQERANHIFSKQLYGLAVTELTSLLTRRSLYCSKTANNKYSVCTKFRNEEGNILFSRIDHKWENKNCSFCGASIDVYDRGKELETYAYQFIHTNKPEEIFKNMKFDVIVGNPPYQLSDGGHGRSAGPIYHKFVEQAKKLQPRYLVMIIPSRWFAGGKGLNDFRTDMLNDKRIRKIVDYENSSDIFPGVDVAGGICYFLWDRDNLGNCEVISMRGNKPNNFLRELNEFPIFIRDSRAIPIIKKVSTKAEDEGRCLDSVVSSRKPFGLPTNYAPKKKGTPCWFIQRIGLQFANSSDISDGKELLDKWKLLIPKAPIAGQTDFSKSIGFYYEGNIRIAKPGECCTESWIVACAFSTKAEVISFKSYLLTKTVRFLLLQTVISQDVTRQNFFLIPDLGKYSGEYTDKTLIKKWGLSQEDWEYIDSRIS
ncbi:Eco57I restriction-modification methylase domain-containing protein [Clostridium sp.]|uniref:Eco57I restriction-modification methylase domain-containing protein n=1 Tax=Clostridium sp. TaxID=1506 RepID=UPI00283F037A|nr:Eco57I restriction-modification methylase domain-containing protein [Clostridium sp.]MDR3596645.1 Eco57I restriction-modification methylase domain-containing protein [Clostridium sp.]